MIKLNNIRKERYNKFSFIKPLLNHTTILAGGALTHVIDRTLEINDLDLFFVNIFGTNKKQKKDSIEKNLVSIYGYEKTFQCEEDELRTFSHADPESKPKVQLIDLNKKLYFKIEDVIDSFDINAGRLAYDGNSFFATKEAIKDIKRRHISLNKLTYPSATIKRISKYRDKGYKITLASLDFVRLMREQPAEEMDDEIVYVD